LQAKLATQVEETSEVQSKLQDAERRFNSAESGMEFLHTELSGTRRRSEQVKEALAVEKTEVSVLRCRVRELEAKVDEFSGPSAAACVTSSFADNDVALAMPKKLDAVETPGDAGRQEFRETKGREPLSDMTGNWQSVRDLETSLVSAKKPGRSARQDNDLSAFSPDVLFRDTPATGNRLPFTPATGNRLPFTDERCRSATSNKSDHALVSPAASSSKSTARYGLQTSRLREPDVLAASITSSSSVATRLSGCLSPADWLVGSRALGSPEICEMGLQHLGGRSLECSPASQARGYALALPASPSANNIIGDRRGESPLRGTPPHCARLRSASSPLAAGSPLRGGSPLRAGPRGLRY